jgi:acyl-CoA synthetase (NDP forming)
LLADDGVDAVLVAYAAAVAVDVDRVSRAVAAGAAAVRDKPVVGALFAPGVQLSVIGGERTIPNFQFADAAGRSLGKAAEYGRWRQRSVGAVPEHHDVDRERAEEIAASALANAPDGVRLEHEDSWRLVRAAGLHLVEQRVVRSASEAATAAAAIGFPVSLKATGLAHFPKSEAGGLALDLQSEPEVVRAYDRMIEHLGRAMVPAVVQQMAQPGLDLRLRLLPDPIVGAAIGLGPGGAAGESLLDDAVQVVPLTDASAAELVARSRCAAGLERSAVAHLVEALLRLSWLADEIPSLAELSLDPTIVTDEGAVVIDVAARVAPWRREQDLPVRRIGT